MLFGMSRLLLPAELGACFRVSDALALGVGEGRLRGSDLGRPFHGARMRVAAADPAVTAVRFEDEERRELMLRIQAYLPVMPSRAFFVGPTAAAVWGIPLPRGLHDQLHVGFLHPGSAPRRPGIRGIQVQPHLVNVVTRSGLRVSSPASTWAMLAPHLTPYDLVAAADAVLRIPRHPGGFRKTTGVALARRGQLEAALSAGPRRGAAALRRALERARTGSSSRPETWTRLSLIDGGLPEPELDQDVIGAHGEFLGCSELVYSREQVAIEYESDLHLTRRQLERDIDKYEAYAAIGWRVVRLTSTHVFLLPGESVRRVTAALAGRS